MFIDEAEIAVEGGDGGAGKVAFFVNKKGPSGGNGGKGGNLYFVASQNVSDLKKYSKKNIFKAEDGQGGESNRRLGANGKDLYLQVPINTTLTDINNNEEITLSDLNSSVLVCGGGAGGFGNDSFKTATDRTPKRATPGQKGQVRRLKLILKLIADYGLIGLPNAGKSSLLNELTNAKARIASYPFTTLEPNLGVINGKILTDIPGLIEGASMGKGLGIKFLKHIEKVTLLLHCISAESDDAVSDFHTINQELEKFNPELITKNRIILLTKSDLVDSTVLVEKINKLAGLKYPIYTASIYDLESIEKIKQLL